MSGDGARSGRDSIFGRTSPREDVDRELQAHLAMRAEELEREGMGAEEAREEAERLFGDRSAIAAECRRVSEGHHRAVRRGIMWEAMWQDLRYAVRTLARSPGFTLASVLTLAMGIGANAAIFSVTYGVLLRPLPYDQPDQLVRMRETNNRGGPMSVAWPNFLDWREESRSFEHVAAYQYGSTTVLGAERPLNATVANVTADFWSVFRAVPIQGRLTTLEDDQAEVPSVLVVSRRLWQNQLGGLPLDQITLEVNGAPSRVVGVVADGFGFPSGAEIWAPASSTNTSRTSHNWNVIARLSGGTTLDVAEEELDALTRTIVLREPDADPDFVATGATVITLREQIVGAARTPLILLFGAAGLVLLVACTNIASTLLARGTNRARELAIRSSLGAGRRRVIRQLLTESVVLSGLGAGAGVLVALAVTRALRTMGPASLPRVEDIAVDGAVLAFTASVAVVAALLFGVFPALRLTRTSASQALRQGGRGGSVGHRGPVWKLLVGTEVAVALVLLTGSGLLVRSFQQLLGEELGFDATEVVTVPVTLSRVRYETEYDHARWYSELIETLEANPSIRSAGIMSSLPAGGSLPNYRLELDGDLSKQAIGGYVVVSPGAFEAYDIPLLAGRHFGSQDTPESGHVAIVSESFAEENWPGESAIGKQVTGGGMDNFWEDRIFAEVVGVVGDVRVRDVAAEPYPTVYFPYTQRPFRIQYGTQVVAEAENGGAGAMAETLRSTIQRLDADVPVEIVPQSRIVDDAMASRRFMMMLLGGFSVVGLLLAGVGIYGVVAYSVARRTREMGIRVALGADPASVRTMVVTSSMKLVGGGVVVGLVAAALSARLLETMLYGVAPFDPVTLLTVTAVLLATALLASWVPARTGTRTDPMVTMRAE